MTSQLVDTMASLTAPAYQWPMAGLFSRTAIYVFLVSNIVMLSISSEISVYVSLGISFSAFLFACITCFLKAYRLKSKRKMWIWTGSGFAIWVIAQIQNAYNIFFYDSNLVDESTLGKIAMILYASGSLCMVIGLLYYPCMKLNNIGKFRLFLDGSITVLAIFVSLWTIYLGPLQKKYNISPSSFSSVLLLAVSDLILFSISFTILSRVGDKNRKPVLMLMVGFLLSVFTDFCFVAISNEYYSGMIVDTGWSMSAIIVGVSMLSMSNQDSNESEQHMGLIGSFSPYIFAYVAIISLCIIMSFEEATIVHGISGGALLFVVLLRQILALLENRFLFKKVEYQSLHDPLTGLANRSFFADRLHRLANKARDSHRCALLSCDVDNFKGINDTYGHAAGDAVLIAFANRLLSSTRASDTVSRLGGDEFAILIENIHDADPSHIGQRYALALQEPIDIGNGQFVTVSASIGFVLTFAEKIKAEDVSSITKKLDAILKAADSALYTAKRQGKAQAIVVNYE